MRRHHQNFMPRDRFDQPQPGAADRGPHRHHHDPRKGFDPRDGFDPRQGFGGRQGFGPGRGPADDQDGGRPEGFDRPQGGFPGRRGLGRGDGFERPEGFDPREGFGPRDGFGRGESRGRGRGRGRGPHRAPRGDVRTAVLLLLADEPMHGYQLMQTIAERTGGRWSPSPGAIYPTLAQLEDEGLVETTKAGGRKLATLTETGRSHVQDNRDSWADPFPQAPTDDAENPVDLRATLHELSPAIRAVTHTGTDAQIAEAQRILTEARRSIYRLLSEETPEQSTTGEDDASTSSDEA